MSIFPDGLCTGIPSQPRNILSCRDDGGAVLVLAMASCWILIQIVSVLFHVPFMCAGPLPSSITSIEDARYFSYCAGVLSGNGEVCNWGLDCIVANKTLAEGEHIWSHCLAHLHITMKVDYSLFLSATRDLVHCKYQTSEPVWMGMSDRNQAVDVVTYILWHAMQGVSHFVIFDEMSTDTLRESLQPFIDNNVVSYVNVKVRRNQNQNAAVGMRMANDGNASWFGWLDADEFFYTSKSLCMPDLLQTYKETVPTIACVSFNWLLMMSSNSSHLFSAREVLMETNHMCGWGTPDQLVKSFCIPRRTDFYSGYANPHYFPLSSKFTQVNAEGAVISGAVNPINDVNQSFILHYRQTSLSTYVKKRLRGSGDTTRPEVDYQTIGEIINMYNLGVQQGGCPVQHSRFEVESYLRKFVRQFHDIVSVQ